MKRICLLFLLITLPLNSIVFAQKRGAGNVRGKNEETGKTEEVTLYKASYALVIGVSDYTNGWQDLPGVVGDVEDVSAALKTQGFQVTTVLNPKKTELTDAIEKFINDYGYTFENRLLFYYAGHGNTQKSGAGYEQGFIVPSDAPAPKAGNEVEFRRGAVSMDTIERYAQDINAKHALFVFDSCFSGALITKTRSPIPPLITFKTTQPVRQFITAGTDDQEVPDVSEFRKQFVVGLKGEADRNSDGFVTASELADFLQDKVSRYTRGSQTPQYGKIRDSRLDKGDFVFVLPDKQTETTAGNEPTIVAKDKAAQEREAWDLVKNSSTASDFRYYLEEFPDGANADKAKIRLEELVWQTVRGADAAKIQAYLKEFPNGANAAAARIRLKQLEASGTPTNTTNNNPTASLKAGAISKASLPNGVEMSFAYIPAGEFQMGLNTEDNEKPIHTVKISQGFFMGQTEVTQAQWKAVMGTTLQQQRDKANSSWSLYGEGANYPIYYVSWEDAQQFIAKLNAQNDGYKYRLPTEAEWEYAARAGTSGDYAGNLDSMAWYSGNSGSSTHEVGTKSPNSWGLYDMHGNVWEWCQDWYEKDYYSKSPTTDPTGASSGSYRVYRGGSWSDAAPGLRSAIRYLNTPSSRYSILGFRVVRQ